MKKTSAEQQIQRAVRQGVGAGIVNGSGLGAVPVS
jgi:hypothetical protein